MKFRITLTVIYIFGLMMLCLFLHESVHWVLTYGDGITDKAICFRPGITFNPDLSVNRSFAYFSYMKPAGYVDPYSYNTEECIAVVLSSLILAFGIGYYFKNIKAFIKGK